jgi:autotransporter-associated beta strand protein
VTANLAGGVGMNKNSAGTVTLSGANTFTGLTTLNNGVLTLASAGALGGGGNIAFAGGTLQYSASNTADLSTRIVNSAGAIKVDVNGQTITYGTALAATERRQ